MNKNRKYILLLLFLSCIFPMSVKSMPADSLNPVIDDGILNEFHKNNAGRIIFMKKPVPFEEIFDKDFIDTISISDSDDLNIRIYLQHSILYYMYGLFPENNLESLNSAGNFSFRFFIDDSLIYKEDLHPNAGTFSNKQKLTVFRVPFKSTVNEDSWGTFLWTRFFYSGGEEAIGEAAHILRIDIFPYIRKDNKILYGEKIATGSVVIKLDLQEVSEKDFAVQKTDYEDEVLKPGPGISDSALIKELNKKIIQKTFKQITSISLIKDDRLILDEYFNGFTPDSLLDTRSVGKSFASALLGIAITNGNIKSTDATLDKFYDLHEYDNFSSEKEKVSLKNLLTMSSAFKGFDFDDSSPGNEENMYPTDNWVKFALDLPVDSTKISSSRWEYFTAGVVVLGDILDKNVPGGLKSFADKYLFDPLGISKYQWEFTPQNVPNTAGGIRLRSVDLAKFGLLYLKRGMWNNKRIFSRGWADESLSHQISISPETDEFYGYLFWNKTFEVSGKNYESYYASGNGGNKIFIFKELNLVVVITSTAFNKPYAHKQSEKILTNYILPAILR